MGVRPHRPVRLAVALGLGALLAGCAASAAPGPLPTTAGGVPSTVTASPTAATSGTAPTASTSGTPSAPVATTPAKPTPTPTIPRLDQLSLEDRVAWASEFYQLDSGANTSKKVALTFDDCPTSWDSFETTVLAAEKLGISLALFPYGQCLDNGYFDGPFARAHGMYVFNHSTSHPDLTKLTAAQIRAELGSGSVQSSWARTPFGHVSDPIRWIYASKGFRIWEWDIDTLDWDGHKPQSEIVHTVVSQSWPGSTALMHMQEHAFNPTALKQMKDGLAARGIEVCANHGPVEQYPRALNC